VVDDFISRWSGVLAAQDNVAGGSASLSQFAAILADDIRQNFGNPSALLICAWCTSTQASEATHPDHSPPSLLWGEFEEFSTSLDRVRLVVDKGQAHLSGGTANVALLSGITGDGEFPRGGVPVFFVFPFCCRFLLALLRSPGLSPGSLSIDTLWTVGRLRVLVEGLEGGRELEGMRS
jgi:hypothetical protein